MKSRLSTQQVDNLCRSELLPGSGHEPAHSSAFPLNLARHLVSSPGHLHPTPHSPHLCPKMPLAPSCALHAQSPWVYQRLPLHSSNHFQHYSLSLSTSNNRSCLPRPACWQNKTQGSSKPNAAKLRLHHCPSTHSQPSGVAWDNSSGLGWWWWMAVRFGFNNPGTWLWVPMFWKTWGFFSKKLSCKFTCK